MALWMIRAGRHGEHEEKFFDHGRIYLTWEALGEVDLGSAKDYAAIKSIVERTYPDEKPRKLGNWAGQIWAFALAMKPNDWVATPRHGKPAIAVGQIIGSYRYDPKGEPGYKHSRQVKWLNVDTPRSVFGKDLLFSFGAVMTICEVRRNNAQARIERLAKTDWAPEAEAPVSETTANVDDAESELRDLDRIGRDLIAAAIIRKYKGHGMARLVEGVLHAQGYTVYRSPEGPDNGVDLLAAPGPLGFEQPRICVQVKSSDAPVDLPTLHQLLGSMQNVGANQGLLVSWGGFKSSIDRQIAAHFFRVRLWDQDTLIDQILEHYDKLDEELRTELPLKQVWTVAEAEEE